jgi:hypothetical protein
VAGRLATLGAPPPLAAGVRMALERGRGRTAVPVRAAIVGAIVGILGVAAVLTFGASLLRLLDEPDLAGWNWDAAVIGVEGVPTAEVLRRLGPRVTEVVGVEAVAALRISTADVSGKETQLLGFESLRGSIEPTIIAGRAPLSDNEVALGTDTLRRLDAGVGGEVELDGPEGPVAFEVVGTTAFSTQSESVAEGATFTMDGLERLAAYVGNTDLVVEWAPAADVDAGLAALQDLTGEPPVEAFRPAPLRNLARVDAIPPALAGFLAVLAAAAVGHTLVTSVGRRRRDLAVLGAMGFVRRQVAATVAWQSATLVAVGLVVGLPVGVAVGRAAWSSVSRGLGVVDAPAVPVLGLSLAVVGAFALAGLLAVVPGRRASRLRPAVVLRSE